MLDSSTFKIAIALAASAVPGNSKIAGSAPRSSSPAVSTPSAASRIASSPKRRFSQAAKAETTPKQITGVAASSDSPAEDRCSRVCRSGNSGGRLVMAVRRLNPAAATATTSSGISYGRRGGPDWGSGIKSSSYRNLGKYFFSRTNRAACARPAWLKTGQEQQCARGPPGREILLRPPRVGQRIGPADPHVELAAGDPGEDLAG